MLTLMDTPADLRLVEICLDHDMLADYGQAWVEEIYHNATDGEAYQFSFKINETDRSFIPAWYIVHDYSAEIEILDEGIKEKLTQCRHRLIAGDHDRHVASMKPAEMAGIQEICLSDHHHIIEGYIKAIYPWQIRPKIFENLTAVMGDRFDVTNMRFIGEQICDTRRLEYYDGILEQLLPRAGINRFIVAIRESPIDVGGVNIITWYFEDKHRQLYSSARIESIVLEKRRAVIHARLVCN